MTKTSIRPDRVTSEDLSNLGLVYSCEDCAHFDVKQIKCTLGLNCIPHLKANQEKKYSLSGEMLFCRFIEIE